MDYKKTIEILKHHKSYLKLDHDRGCNYTNLLNALDVAINAVQNCNKEKINLILDGNAWCAFRDGFTNLQESNAGFGDIPIEAIENLKSVEQLTMQS